jgi:hypothetical protein
MPETFLDFDPFPYILQKNTHICGFLCTPFPKKMQCTMVYPKWHLGMEGAVVGAFNSTSKALQNF